MRHCNETRQRLKKTQHVLYFRKAGALRISNMILRGGVATKSKSQKVRKSAVSSHQQHQRISSISVSAESAESADQQKVRKSAVLPTFLMSFLSSYWVGIVGAINCDVKERTTNFTLGPKKPFSPLLVTCVVNSPKLNQVAG